MNKKIGIIGCGGVGKTTLAEAIIRVLDTPNEVIVISDNDIIPKQLPINQELLLKPTPLLPEPIFIPPLSRKERRKQERLKTKKYK